jgi:hypothetical protein
MTAANETKENKEESRQEDLQALILNTLTYGSGATNFEQQITKDGFSHQEVYFALEVLNKSGTIRITESASEYSPATGEIHEWREYSLKNNITRKLKVHIYRRSKTKAVS